MKAGTKIGLVTGGVVGAAVGAGLLLSNNGRQLRKAVSWGADQVKSTLHNKIG